jgi:hypothetical protein
VAEGARLESVYTGNRIVGSNPTPSARASGATVLRSELRLIGGSEFGLSDTGSVDSEPSSAGEIALSRPLFLRSSVLLHRVTVARNPRKFSLCVMS